MENQFENMDLLDDDLIDFDEEDTQEFMESKAEDTSEDSSKSKKPIYIATGIVAMLTIILGTTYLLNGDISPEQEQPEQTLSAGISPNNKVDPETFDMNTYDYETFREPIDVDNLEREDTLIYWDNPYNDKEFIGISEDGQIFGRIDEEEAKLLDDEEYQAQLRAEEEERIQEYWKENPDEAPPGEWLEDGTYKVDSETVLIDIIERQEVVTLTPDGEVLLDAQDNEMTHYEDVVVGQEELTIEATNAPGRGGATAEDTQNAIENIQNGTTNATTVDEDFRVS